MTDPTRHLRRRVLPTVASLSTARTVTFSSGQTGVVTSEDDMANRPGIHVYCGDASCSTCRKNRLEPGHVVAFHRHPRTADGKRRLEQKTFASRDAGRNLRDANAWKDRREGVGQERGLPRGITRGKTKAGSVHLVATVPAWADPTRPKRHFSEDELEAAVAWLQLATEARTAEPPLPLPEPVRKGAGEDTALVVHEAAPTLLGELVLRWHHFYYQPKLAGKTLRGDKRARHVRGLIERHILAGNAADPKDRSLGPINLGTVRLAELTRQHLLNALANMASKGIGKTQTDVAWVLKSACNYGFNEGWIAKNPAHGRLEVIPPTAEQLAKRHGRGPKADRPRPSIPPLLFSRLAGRVLETHGLEAMLAGALSYYGGGLRPGEAVGPAMGDIDRRRWLLAVTKQAGRLYDCHDEDGNPTQAYWVEAVKTEAGERFAPIPEVLRPYVEEQYARRIAEGATDADAFLFADLQTSQKLVYEAWAAAAEGLLPEIGPGWSPFVPYDLRHQAITNYSHAGIPDDIRSYIAGHADDDQGMTRRKRKRNRGAAITYRVYTHTYLSRRTDDEVTDFDLALAKAGQQLNDWVLAKLDGHPIVAAPAPVEDDLWATYQEAMEVLGVTWPTVMRYVERGLLTERRITHTRKWKAGGVNLTKPPAERRQVLRSDLHALADKHGGVVSITEASAVLGLTRQGSLRRFMELVGVTPHNATTADGLGRMEKYVTVDELLLLKKHNEERLAFLAEHCAVDAIATEFSLPKATMKRWLAMELIETVEPPLGEVAGHTPVTYWVHRATATKVVTAHLRKLGKLPRKTA